MKILLGAGILLLISTLGMPGTSFSTAMFQVSLVLLLGAMVLFVIEKRLTSKSFFIWKIIGVISFCLMVFLTIWGFITGAWNWHPLGLIISLAGCGWVFYKINKNKDLLIDTNRRNNYNLPNNLKYVKWLSIPICVILALWIFQSIWISFIVGMVIICALDWDAIKIKGINRIVAILIIYSITFFFLLLILTKIQYEGWFGNAEFFSNHTYYYLRDIIKY